MTRISVKFIEILNRNGINVQYLEMPTITFIHELNNFW